MMYTNVGFCRIRDTARRAPPTATRPTPTRAKSQLTGECELHRVLKSPQKGASKVESWCASVLKTILLRSIGYVESKSK